MTKQQKNYNQNLSLWKSYIFTVVISKGRSSTQKTVEVEIMKSNCEIILQTYPTSVIVNPQKEVSTTEDWKVKIVWKYNMDQCFKSFTKMYEYLAGHHPCLCHRTLWLKCSMAECWRTWLSECWDNAIPWLWSDRQVWGK